MIFVYGKNLEGYFYTNHILELKDVDLSWVYMYINWFCHHLIRTIILFIYKITSYGVLLCCYANVYVFSDF